MIQQDFDIVIAPAISKAQRSILLPESACEELFRNRSKLLKQCQGAGRAGFPAFFRRFHIR